MDYLDILVRLRKVIRSINLESKKIEKGFGVSIPQLLVLQFISTQPDYRTSASEIKDYINLNASTVSGIIARLVSKELVSRLQKTDDKRVTYLTLTAKGMDVLKKSPTTLQEKLSSRLKELSDEQIEELSKNIDLLIRLMDVEHVQASPVITGQEIANSE